jgi:DNA repair exonuclease SbcCD ATPase subunit
MSTPQISLADCLTEMNNALNYWYPLPVQESKLDEELGRYRPYGASREECDARHVRLFQFRYRLQEQLKQAGKDADFDLAMAMAELRSVAQQRDKALTERDAARAGYAAMSRRIYGPGGECFELDKARAERDKLKIERDSANWSLSRAKESLRAAEADLAETDQVNADLRTVNARLVADLAAATQRADTAEAILRAKA